MTDIVTPPTIAPLPPPPQPSDTPAEFDAKSFASLAAQVAMTQQANASAAATQQNATAAQERAVAANASATTATQQADAAMGYRNQAGQHAGNAANSANAANSSAIAAAASEVAASKLNLGDKATPPTADNQGQPLRVGATYYDTRPAPNGGWKVWTGGGWERGVSDIAGVSSVNNKTGAVTLSPGDVGALAVGQYGFGAAVLPAGVLDLNAAEARSMQFMGSGMANAPGGGWFLVQQLVHDADWITQLAYGFSGLDGQLFARQKQNGVWHPWRAQSFINSAPVALSGGAADCRKGDYFTETVNGARTLSFVNIPDGAYYCTIEILHLSGAITLPADAVWSGGVVPTFAVNKRHLLDFQRSQTGSSGWIVSARPGSAT